MFCEKCGAPMAENAKFCTACGNKISKEKKQRSVPKALWIIGAVVLGLLVIAVVLNLTGVGEKLWNGKQDPSSQSGTSPTEKPQENQSTDDKKDDATAGDVTIKSSYTVENTVAEEHKDTVVATVGNQTLTNGELQAYYWSAVYEFIDYYGTYISYSGLDLTKPLHQQVYNHETGMTFQQMFLETALENWYQYAVIKELSLEANFQLDGDQQAYLDTMRSEVEAAAILYGYTDVETFIDEQFYPGCSFELYLKYSEMNYIALAYYDSVCDGVNPTMEEIEAYYSAHESDFKSGSVDKSAGDYYDVRHILVGIEGDADSEGKYTDAQWAACLEKAQTLLQEYLTGEKTEDAFAEMAKIHSQDPGSAENGGLYTNLYKGYGFIENFENWYLEEGRQPGDTGIIQNTQSSVQGYHIMYFVNNTPKWEWEARNAIVVEAGNQLLEDGQTKWSMTVDYAKIVLSTVDLAS